ncbi:hypothetical protein EDC05_003146 [Coemansia umbellata]|uniref:Uncharacterized protein n=1 Tax=Coemansia umbellata TaxID=1424467 RepID=A0ABQ8PMW5_9FUNG|nr:hypothetical protein EDC05_003146 [Coemansia umbellata]
MDMQEEVEQSNVDSADNVSPEVSSKAEPTLSNSRALPTSINTLDPSNAVSQTATDALPFDLSTSIGSIDISGNSGESSSMVTGTSPTHVDVGNLSAALDLNFNVDSLNLDNLSALSGLDFDVSSLLTQMNSQAETDPAISSALEISDAPTSAALPSEASIALITTEFTSKQASTGYSDNNITINTSSTNTGSTNTNTGSTNINTGSTNINTGSTNINTGSTNINTIIYQTIKFSTQAV